MQHVSPYLLFAGKISRLGCDGLFAVVATVLLTLTARGAAPMSASQVVSSGAVAQPAMVQESRLKAAYLVKFTQYTTWPAAAFSSETAPLVIGVFGSSLLPADLEQEARAITGHRPIEICVVTTLEEAGRCHAIFISRTDGRLEENWLQALREKSILTVGESDHAIEHGAIIRLVMEGKNIRFEVSRPAMERAALKISPDMLRYAKTVHNQAPPPH